MHSAGIYIHIPFCERKCTYCNFNTTDFDNQLASRYVTAVTREISHWGKRLADTPVNSGRPLDVDSIFFGGGTPSTLLPQQLGQILEACRGEFEIVSGAEITIEVNPSTTLQRNADGWLASGINRVSLGVQSFIDTELAALSRTHSAGDARDAVTALRGAGFSNVSLDLIAGLPGQSLSDWEYNLLQAFECLPRHLSLYLLEVKEGTQLHSQIKRGQRPQPDDDLAAAMYQSICKMAAEHAFEQYEISNFARHANSADEEPIASPYRSKHNLKYWQGGRYYGIGCGAHSYDGRDRWFNIKRTESYIESVNQWGSAVAERQTLSDHERAAEALFMGLRLIEGVDLNVFHSTYGLDVARVYSADLERLAEAGLIEIHEGRLRLTNRGLVLSNEVFQVFV